MDFVELITDLFYQQIILKVEKEYQLLLSGFMRGVVKITKASGIIRKEGKK